jgi:hypothetical protein
MVIIVGCNHGIQGEIKDWSWCLDTRQIEKARDQRKMFKQMLERLIQKFSVCVIAEEWGHPERTIARKIARRKRIRWGNINTTQKERRALGIPDNYVGTDSGYSKDQVSHWHSLRERVMFRKTTRLKGSPGPVLLICGFCHFGRLTKLFRRTGENVRVKDYTRLPWYEEEAFPS